MRKCNKCSIEKELVDFALKSGSLEGRNRVCKKCKVEENQIRQFGITTTTAYQITKTCHMCNKDLSNAKICIDHDHTTGRVRGILCSACNTGIGLLGDNIEGVERALRYLSTPPYPI